MPAEIDERSVSGGFVAGGLETEAVALPGAHVPLGAELGTGPRQREVHVEEDRA
jgi:hypothetical protein